MRPRGLLGTAIALGGGAAMALAIAAPAPAQVPAPQATSTPTPQPTTTSTPTPTPTSSPTPPPTSSPTPTPTGTSGSELVYVANADSGPVTAYNATSTGAVAPARTIANPQNPNTVWIPWGVTFDNAGNLYVQTFLSDATTFVFPPNASGSTLPSRIFQADAPDNRSVAVDAYGYEYVVGGEAGSTLMVEPPGASGVPSQLYHVPPLRTAPLNNSFIPWPSALSVDSQNEVLAAYTSSQGNAIKVFAGGANGSATPLRTISGPDTGLGACVSPCAELAITYSPRTGLIYAAVSDGTTASINEYSVYSSGDARPIRTIQGPATGLSGSVITGIAVSRNDGTIYTMVKSAQFGAPGHINAYTQYAQGDAAPLRSFTDSASAFNDAAGIAVR